MSILNSINNNMTNYECDLKSYNTISILGQCFEGKAVVYLAKHKLTGKMVAIKKFNMDKIKEDIHLVEQEIILTRQLKHPHVIQYHVAFVHTSEVCVVSPLMGFGSCRDLLNTHFNEGLPEPAIVLILKDLLEALEYIHKKGFIHRAVRASHILISTSGKASLSGLRYACPIVMNGKWQKTIHSFPNSTSRNLNWLSPELLEQNLQGYNEKSDIYSVGMLLCELANGSEPYAGYSTTLMLTEKVGGHTPHILDSTTIPPYDSNAQGDCDLSYNVMNRKFSNGLHEIESLCLHREPYDRPSAALLLTHPLFKHHKRLMALPELLKPAMPLSERVAYNRDEMANLEDIQHLSEMDLYSYDWDF